MGKVIDLDALANYLELEIQVVDNPTDFGALVMRNRGFIFFTMGIICGFWLWKKL